MSKRNNNQYRVDRAPVPKLLPRFITRLLSVVFVFGAAGHTMAQQQDVLEEVIVTAQKREQNQQDVGISMATFSGSRLKSLNVEKSHDVADFAPGVMQSGNLAGQNTQFSIRGVTQNDFNDIIESPNAVYLDDGYIAIANAQTFSTFDIERVEILKGPQGTLFGRNATGGLVHYHSRQPTFDGYEGYIDVTTGLYDSDADATEYQVEAAYGGPLADTLAGRVALKFNQHDGYLNNEYPLDAVGGATFGLTDGISPASPGDPEPGADLGDNESLAFRGILLFEPNADLSIRTTFNYGENEVSTGPYQSKPTMVVLQEDPAFADDPATPQREDLVVVGTRDVGPNETRQSINLSAGGADAGADLDDNGSFGDGGVTGRPVPGGDFFGYRDPDGNGFDITSGDFAFNDQGETESTGVNVTIDWTMPNEVLATYIGDYKKYDKLLFIDVDSAPVNQSANYAGVDGFSVSQELRFSGTTERMQWVGGFYYLHIDSESDNGLKFPTNSIPVAFSQLGPAPLPLSGTDVGVQAELITDSFNVFGQVEYDLTSDLMFTAGFRVIQEEKDYDMRQGLFFSTTVNKVNVGEPFVTLNTFATETSDTLWSGKLQLDWHPRENLLLYAGVNRGVKAGSFNAPIPGGRGRLRVENIPYEEEVLRTIEGGFKSTLFNGTTRLNGSLYYYDYEDYQAFLFTGVAGLVINRDGDTFGGELSLESSPIRGLDLVLSAAAFDATVEDLPLVIGTSLPTRDVDPTYAPETQVSGLVRYEWPIQAVGGLFNVQFDFSYSDEFFYNLRNFEADKFDSYVLVNSEVGWTSEDGHWNARFMVNNLTDESAGVQGFNIASFCGCNEVSYRAPRWYALNLSYSFF